MRSRSCRITRSLHLQWARTPSMAACSNHRCRVNQMTTKSTKTTLWRSKINEKTQVALSTRSTTNTLRSTPLTSATPIFRACSHVWHTTDVTESMSSTPRPVTSRSMQDSLLDSTLRSTEPGSIEHQNHLKLFLKNYLLPMSKFTRRSMKKSFS